MGEKEYKNPPRIAAATATAADTFKE